MKRIRRLIWRYIFRKSPDEIELASLIEKGLTVGTNTTINAGFSIDSAWAWLIKIGNDVTISTNVAILAHDASTNVARQSTVLGKVEIGDNVFIGTRTIILCGTTIGNNVIVGAGSVVTGNIPSDSVYAGVPARRICSIEEFKEKYRKLRETRPDFSTIHPWNKWNESTDEERQLMAQQLSDGIGFV